MATEEMTKLGKILESYRNGTAPHQIMTGQPRPRDQWEGLSYRPREDCPACHGAGFVHPLNQWGEPIYSQVVVCQARGCYNDSVRGYTRSPQYGKELGVRPEEQTFENFKAAEGSHEALSVSLAFASRKADFIWLLVYGGTGNGKSHLCNAVARCMQNDGMKFRYIKAADIHAEVRRSVRDNTGKDTVLDIYKAIPVLIIDDYGVESGTDAQAANMEDILVTRYENLLPTMMTTNMDWSQLPERIASRFDDRQLSRRVHNEAPDYRAQK